MDMPLCQLTSACPTPHVQGSLDCLDPKVIILNYRNQLKLWNVPCMALYGGLWQYSMAVLSVYAHLCYLDIETNSACHNDYAAMLYRDRYVLSEHRKDTKSVMPAFTL